MMDKQYIAMCDTPEIQGQRGEYQSYMKPSSDRVICTQPDFPGGCMARSVKVCEKCEWDIVWLPRQEDIQEMWKKGHPDHKDGIPDNWVTLFIDYFYEWAMKCDYDESLLYGSMGSLQLAFYMDEVHQKTWKDGGWDG